MASPYTAEEKKTEDYQEYLKQILTAMYQKPTRETIAPVLAECVDDPSLFNSAILGGEPFWHRQMDMSQLVVDNNISIILSGNSVGKTHWLARIVLWYLYTRPKAVVITTASSYHQLANGLWTNIRTAFHNARIPLGGKITTTAGASTQSLRLAYDWFAVGVSTTSTERMSGVRSAEGNTMVCVDEASGMSLKVWEGITSLAADKIVLIGNPLHAHGPFFEQYLKAQDPANKIGWMQVSSLESPDIRLLKSPRGMACRTWLDTNEVAWGKGIWWDSHVLARFPTDSDQCLIPSDWLNKCDVPHVPGGPMRISVDLALGKSKDGDNTVIMVRDDNGFVDWKASKLWRLEDTANEVRRLALKWNVSHNRIVFDANGPGTDFANRLMSVGIRGTQEYIGQKMAANKGHYQNMRTAAGYALRRRLDPGRIANLEKSARVVLAGNRVIPAPADVTTERIYPEQFSIPSELMLHLRPQLIAMGYENLSSGKVKLKNRDEVKKVLAGSPDYADSAVIAFSFKG